LIEENVCKSLQVLTNLSVSPTTIIQNFIKYCQTEPRLLLVLMPFRHTWQFLSGTEFGVNLVPLCFKLY